MGVMLLITQQRLPAAIQEAPENPTPLAAASEQDRNKAVAWRVFEEIFNQGKIEVADEIYAPDFVNHGLKTNASLQEDQAAVHQEKAAFPDLKMSVELMVAEGDLVAVVWVFRGTHTHAGYGGMPPTGALVGLIFVVLILLWGMLKVLRHLLAKRRRAT